MPRPATKATATTQAPGASRTRRTAPAVDASADGRTRRPPGHKGARADLQRADWIKAGLHILARAGVDAVLIPPLAKALGVTKGSFYWHFSSREDLLLALIEEWKQHATTRVIEIVERAGTSPQEKIRLIAMIGTSSPIDEFGGAIELAVRNWARVHPEVRRAVADVDRQRLNYLAQLYAEAGTTADPELLACLHYSFSTGLRLIFAYPEKQKLAMRQAALDAVFFRELPIIAS